LLCTATNKKLVTFLFEQLQRQDKSKCLNFQKKLIDTITTINFYLFKENNGNDMAAQVFLAFLHSSQQPSKIGPTADFDGAAIPPPIISMCLLFMLNSISIDLGMVPVGSETTQLPGFLCPHFWVS
jgi:hypothetical protein